MTKSEVINLEGSDCVQYSGQDDSVKYIYIILLDAEPYFPNIDYVYIRFAVKTTEALSFAIFSLMQRDSKSRGAFRYHHQNLV